MIRSTLGRISGLALGLGALALFIYVVGLDELRRVIVQVNPAVMIFMTGIQLLGLIFYASSGSS